MELARWLLNFIQEFAVQGMSLILRKV